MCGSSSGHTQINATDLRLLRYPTQEQLTELGQSLLDAQLKGTQAEIDELVAPFLPSSSLDALSEQAQPLTLVST